MTPAPAELVELPEPAFRLNWKHGAYYVSKPNVGDTDCYTAEQVQEIIAASRAAHERVEVTEEMVRRALDAFLECRGSYENEVEIGEDEIRAALTAALGEKTP